MIGLPRKTIFIDRNSGGRTFRDLIVAAGIRVVLHDEHFKDQKTRDDVWLKEIGRLGWIMVTGDVKIEKDHLFLTTLKRSRSQVFILCELNHGSPEDRSRCVISAYQRVLRKFPQ